MTLFPERLSVCLVSRHNLTFYLTCTFLGAFISSSSRKKHAKPLKTKRASSSWHMSRHVASAVTQLQGCSADWPPTSEPRTRKEVARFSYLFRHIGMMQFEWHTFGFASNQGAAHHFPFTPTKNKRASCRGKSHLHDKWHLTFVMLIVAAFFDTVYLQLIKKHTNLNSVHHFYTLQTLLAVKIHLIIIDPPSPQSH